MKIEQQRDADDADAEHRADRPRFRILSIRLQRQAAKRDEMAREIERRRDHQHTHHELDGHRVVVAEAVVVRGEAAQRERRHAMTDCIEPGHPGGA